ncbi:MAG TPA: hypothetical protein PLK94_11245, partial [Alphaproteobacteria bacterium]|nr:hypothetical protein [Alphaproteobacteria bacterium]
SDHLTILDNYPYLGQPQNLKQSVASDGMSEKRARECEAVKQTIRAGTYPFIQVGAYERLRQSVNKILTSAGLQPQ